LQNDVTRWVGVIDGLTLDFSNEVIMCYGEF